MKVRRVRSLSVGVSDEVLPADKAVEREVER
jgi:hypothetical protein